MCAEIDTIKLKNYVAFLNKGKHRATAPSDAIIEICIHLLSDKRLPLMSPLIIYYKFIKIDKTEAILH